MRTVRCAFMAVLVTALFGCGFLDSQLQRDPTTGESRLEQEVKAAQPVLGPYGALATAGATLLTAIYGAFRSHRADVQTDKNGNGVPDDQEKSPTA